MKKDHIKYLVCPKCSVSLKLLNERTLENNRIESGKLHCLKCNTKYPIIKFIPRFVPRDNYASGFGLEWTIHHRTQYDKSSGINESRERFFNETKWPQNMQGETLLEVGSGSGRFTEQAISTKAMVVSLDYSYAVEANYASNGHHDNVLIVQGDLYSMPFQKNYFDKIFCIGVLQHTPDVEKSFSMLPLFLKRGGKLTVDFYRKFSFFKQMLVTKYWVRPITKRIPPQNLYKFISTYVNIMWPICNLIHKLPYGKSINWMLLVADYRDKFNLPEESLKEWAILDTFDMLAPAFDFPQTLASVKKMFEDNNIQKIDIHYGYNGIEGRGEKASD